MTQAQDLATFSQLFTAGVYPGRNRVINGDCRVQQLPPSNAVTGTWQYGGVDRFGNVCGSGTTPGVQQWAQSDLDDIGIARYWVKQVVTTAVTDFSTNKYWGGITHLIMGTNCYDMKGGPISVRFKFKAKLPGVYSVVLFDSTFVNCIATNITVPAADTPYQYYISFPPCPLTMGMNAGLTTYLALRIGGINKGTLACPAAQLNTWLTPSSMYYTTDTSVNWGATLNNYIQATEIQVEPGPYCTPFERVIFEDQLQRCRAYCSTSYPTPASAFAASQDGSAMTVYTGPTGNVSSYIGVIAIFSPPMRVNPVVTVYNPHTGVAGSAWAQNAAASLTAGIGNYSPYMAQLSVLNQNVAGGDVIKFHYVAMAELP